MTLNIHQTIKEKLKYFYDIRKIPNIIFNGPSGSGKSTIVNDFISMIYEDKRKSVLKIAVKNCMNYITTTI